MNDYMLDAEPMIPLPDDEPRWADLVGEVKPGRIVLEHARWAYAFPATILTPFDPELCVSCQRTRPTAGSLCATCDEAARHA